MTASETIAEVARRNPNADPKALARRIYAGLSRAQFIELIADEIADQQRRLVKIVEEDILDALFAKASPTPKIVVSADDPLRLLFGHMIAFGAGESVLAEDMTLDQWVARRAMLVSQRNGIDRAVEVCDAVIDRIQSAGIQRLRDLGISKAA